MMCGCHDAIHYLLSVYWNTGMIYKLMNEEGVWQELLQNKYLKTKTLS
jgi:hypothetical protein